MYACVCMNSQLFTAINIYKYIFVWPPCDFEAIREATKITKTSLFIFVDFMNMLINKCIYLEFL